MAKVQASIDIAAPVQHVWDSGVVSGHAGREANGSLARLKFLAEG